MHAGSPQLAPEIERVVSAASAMAQAYLHPRRIILFGSHARGDAQPTSDIDLAVEAPSATDSEWLQFLSKARDEIPTLRRIDWVRVEDAPPALLAAIGEEGIVIHGSER